MKKYKEMLQKYGLNVQDFEVENIGNNQAATKEPCKPENENISIDELNFDSPALPPWPAVDSV